jgi:hypothetical protein
MASAVTNCGNHKAMDVPELFAADRGFLCNGFRYQGTLSHALFFCIPVMHDRVDPPHQMMIEIRR